MANWLGNESGFVVELWSLGIGTVVLDCAIVSMSNRSTCMLQQLRRVMLRVAFLLG